MRAEIIVTGDWTGAAIGFHELSSKLKDTRKPLFEGMKKFMTGPVKKRFMAGGIPLWRRRNPEKSWPILRKTGAMMRSVTLPTSTNKNIQYPDKHSITLSSKVPYAPYHDKERGNTAPNTRIPGRPFLEIMVDDADTFLDIMLKWSVKEARQSFGNRTG